MTEQRDHELELRRILDGVVEAILEAPEEEIDGDLRAAGIDPDVAAEGLRKKLEMTVEQARAHREADAKRRIQQNLLMMKIHPLELPETAKERMRLLGAVLHRKPKLREKLSIDAIESLDDEDVTRYLRQLAEIDADDAVGKD